MAANKSKDAIISVECQKRKTTSEIATLIEKFGETSNSRKFTQNNHLFRKKKNIVHSNRSNWDFCFMEHSRPAFYSLFFIHSTLMRHCFIYCHFVSLMCIAPIHLTASISFNLIDQHIRFFCWRFDQNHITMFKYIGNLSFR